MGQREILQQNLRYSPSPCAIRKDLTACNLPSALTRKGRALTSSLYREIEKIGKALATVGRELHPADSKKCISGKPCFISCP